MTQNVSTTFYLLNKRNERLGIRRIPSQRGPVHVLVDTLSQSLTFDLANPPTAVGFLVLIPVKLGSVGIPEFKMALLKRKLQMCLEIGKRNDEYQTRKFFKPVCRQALSIKLRFKKCKAAQLARKFVIYDCFPG